MQGWVKGHGSAEATIRYLLEKLLTGGAIDALLVGLRTPDGRHVFLEINPAGEWEWIQATVGHPIADALADVLTGRVEVDRGTPQMPATRR